MFYLANPLAWLLEFTWSVNSSTDSVATVRSTGAAKQPVAAAIDDFLANYRAMGAASDAGAVKGSSAVLELDDW